MDHDPRRPFGETAQVGADARQHDGVAYPTRGGDDERVDRVARVEPVPAEEVACELGDGAVGVDHPRRSQNSVDAPSAGTAGDLGQHRGRDPGDATPTFDGFEHGLGSAKGSGSFGWMGEDRESLAVEDRHRGWGGSTPPSHVVARYDSWCR